MSGEAPLRFRWLRCLQDRKATARPKSGTQPEHSQNEISLNICDMFVVAVVCVFCFLFGGRGPCNSEPRFADFGGTCVYATAWLALHWCGRIQPGERAPASGQTPRGPSRGPPIHAMHAIGGGNNLVGIPFKGETTTRVLLIISYEHQQEKGVAERKASSLAFWFLKSFFFPGPLGR